MATYCLKTLFAVLVCFLHTEIYFILGFNSASESSHVKCIDSERRALLNFKRDNVDDSGMLSTWRDDDNNRDCCKWKGIQCDNETGRVHMLDLHGHYPRLLSGVINISSLNHLQNIEYLNLSNNNFEGSHIPKLIGSFTNLKYLDLSSLGFGGRIPYELGNLSKLEYLDLSRNSLDGAIPSQFGNLTSLQHLDLSFNILGGGEFPSAVCKITSLQHLDLSTNNLGGKIPFEVGRLTSLRHLDLSSTSLHGEIPSEVGKLTSLRFLDLRYNFRIHGEIPCHFQNLSQLQYLDLGGVNLSGPIPFQVGGLPILHTLRLEGNFDLKINYAKWLSSLSFLTTLDLRSLHSLGSSHYWQQMIGELIPNLRELRLVDCNLTDESVLALSAFVQNSSSSLVFLYLSSNLLKSSAIFHWISNFTINLHSLQLDENMIEGRIPDEFVKALNSLEFLDLSGNKLQGEIPASFGNIGTLQELHLNNNNLIGEMPKSIGLLHELEYLNLHGNNLEGDITELHLTSLSKLVSLDLTDNSLSLKFATTWVPPFQLYTLGLASCKLGPSFPRWLKNQNWLSFLDISDAGIDDFVPEWFWSKLQTINVMNMSHNSLKGTIPNLPIKFPYVTTIILNSNKLEGEIPAFFSQVDTLDLSQNKISDFNKLLCGSNATVNMFTLDLSNNQIMGELPDCWEKRHGILINELNSLDLSNNKLSGKIPRSIGTLDKLEALVLRNNSLTGDIPFTLKNCTNLVVLDLSENLLSGPIPSWIGESLQQLKILSLRENKFFGNVHAHICYLRQIRLLDLSRNNLYGGVPTCLKNFTAMMELRVIVSERFRRMTPEMQYEDLYEPNVLLMWKGQDYVFWNPENLLSSIDLSSNDLTGEIPNEVAYLLGLVSLNLSRNNLHGEIPFEIGNLGRLEFLDLSRNHFFGEIPSTLSKIDRLTKLDLSNNDLTGRIPWGRQLQTFDASSFEGNVGLCGEQLNKSCPGDKTTTKPQGLAVQDGDDNSVFYEALYMSLGIGFFIGFWGLLGPILLWKPWRIAYVRLLKRLTDYILVMVEVKMAKCHRWLKG